MTLLSEIETEELTPQERLSRVAAILAAGVLRLRRVTRTGESDRVETDAGRRRETVSRARERR